MRFLFNVCLLFVCCGLIFLVAGCGPKTSIPGLVSAAGEITVDGVPMEGVSISFFPVNTGSDNITVGTTSEVGGKFILGYRKAGEGAKPGTYKVTAVKQTVLNPISEEEATKLSEEGKDYVYKYQYDVPQKYGDTKTSGIEITIPEKGDKNIRIELSK